MTAWFTRGGILKNTINYYGKRTQEEITDCIDRVCWLFDSDNCQRFSNACNLITETLATETGLGRIKPTAKSPKNIAQIEEATFDDIKKRAMKYREQIEIGLGIDISAVAYEDLQDELIAILFCRLYYKLSPYPIPETRWLRGVYWKSYYNTAEGAGTVKHYMRMCRDILDGGDAEIEKRK